MSKILRSEEAVNHVLGELKSMGYYDGALDGALGPKFHAAWGKLRSDLKRTMDGQQNGSNSDPMLCWGGKVSRVFRDRVRWMADALLLPKETGADDLMACMAWESNETFSPSIRNMAGSGATGLIQFMPATALAFFHSPEEIKAMSAAEKASKGRQAADRLAALTAEDQLNYVYKYFEPYKGRLRNLGDIYMAILWPAGVGKPDSYELWNKATRPTTYRQNAGLDINKDGSITRAEAIAKVQQKKDRGFLPSNMNL